MCRYARDYYKQIMSEEIDPLTIDSTIASAKRNSGTDKSEEVGRLGNHTTSRQCIR